MSTLVAPHGGTLIDRIVTDARALTRRSATLPRVTLDARELADLELIATGAASPLVGFATPADYEAILAYTRLANGVVWPFPFTLAIADSVPAAPGGELALFDAGGRLWGVLTIT
ncbi:MAG: sulfate adenylyltransferase, partial [Polyangiales bacterium]